MTNYRKLHKEKIKEVLDTIEYPQDTTVSQNYITDADTEVYIFITSGNLTPNVGEASVTSSYLNYERGYSYSINLVFPAPTDNSSESLIHVEETIDLYEQLVLDKLQSAEFRDQSQLWVDAYVDNVSASYQPDPVLNENSIYKTFEITCNQMTSGA